MVLPTLPSESWRSAANEGGRSRTLPFHALRAIILLKTNDSAGAVREAQRAFEIDPSNVDAVSLLASKKLGDGDPDGALKAVGFDHC